MERKYSKDECMALLRDSADARYYRASLIFNGGMLTLCLLLLLLGLLTGEVPWAMALVTAGFLLMVAYDFWQLRRLYGHWDQYIYTAATVGKEEATLDWRYPATALQVLSRGGMGPGMAMQTRNIFQQKPAFGVLDWPLVSEYANCQVIAAFDQKKDRAIILQRDYRTRT